MGLEAKAIPLFLNMEGLEIGRYIFFL